MAERLRFVARLLDGEKMAPLCREFGISRVTGYKIFDRYRECGLDGLHDRSKAPYRQANKLPFQVERAILGIKKEFPTWGTPLTTALAPNELWCVDYKGEFLLGNRQYCYPLTVTDHRSRYLLTCEGLESTKSKFAC